MLRIVLATAVIASIYSYSPQRPGLGLAESLAAATKDASAHLAGAVAASGAGPAMADAVLRRTIADAAPSATAAGTVGARPETSSSRR
ncbi:hypothetical protein [uncultured Enterovirga sp.]|uniref:hypothetical protein n=1 Tax=uncultured Enterovirga sp. TaxID=2026352 RepID=UPI0035CC4AF5